MGVLLRFDGTPSGGALSVSVAVDGRWYDIDTETVPGDPLRTVTAALARTLRQRLDGTGADVDHDRSGVLVLGADDVQAEVEDDGLTVVEEEAVGRLPLEPFTTGYRDAAGDPARSDRVLRDLADTVGSLRDLAAAGSDLAATAGTAAREALATLASPEASDAMRAGAAATAAAADQVLASLSDLGSARAELLEAIAGKEAEAKTPSGAGVPGGQPGSGTGTPVGPPPPTTPTGGGGGGSGTGGGDGGGDGTTREGGGQPTRTVEEPCEIWEYWIAGLRFVIGKFIEDGREVWVLARGQGMFIERPDGTSVWRADAYDFNDSPSDPDLKAKLDAAAAAEQAKAETDTWGSFAAIASLALDLVPIVGDIKGIAEALTGENLLTDEALGTGERLFTLGTALLGLVTLGVASTALRGGAKSVRALDRAVSAGRATGRLDDVGRGAVGDLLSDLRRLQRSAPRDPRALRSNCELVGDLRRPGRSSPRLGVRECVESTTPVALADGTVVPIGTVEPGWLVATWDPEHGRVSAGRVLHTSASRSTRTVRLTLSEGGDEGELTASADHRVLTTDGGWVPAQRLVAGDRVVATRHGSAAVVSASDVAEPIEVCNLVVSGPHDFVVGALGVVVHNGDPCPDWTSLKPAEQAKIRSRMRDALSTLRGLEGQVGSYAKLKGPAREATARYNELYRLRAGEIAPPFGVVTPNHIPSRSLIEKLGLKGLDGESCGAINMTMQRHIRTRTYGLDAVRSNRPYLDAVNNGTLTPRQAFQRALRDDLRDMLDPAKFGDRYRQAADDLVAFYRAKHPTLMQGFGGI